MGRIALAFGAGQWGDRGQGLVEYALILLLIALVAVAILGVLGTQVSAAISQVTTGFPGAGS